MSKGEQSGNNAGVSALAVAGAFGTSIGYAWLLNTSYGKAMEDKHTWFTVVIGVFLTLWWLGRDDHGGAFRALIYFIASGIPMIVRALWQADAELERISNRQRL